MFGIDQHRQSTSATTNETDNSQTTQDNRVALQTGTVLTSAGGALSEQSGGVASSGAGSTVNVSSTSIDPGSYEFASHAADVAASVGAESFKVASNIVGQVTDSVGKIAQGTTLGVDWKSKLPWIAGAVALVAVAAMFLLRRRA